MKSAVLQDIQFSIVFLKKPVQSHEVFEANIHVKADIDFHQDGVHLVWKREQTKVKVAVLQKQPRFS